MFEYKFVRIENHIGFFGDWNLAWTPKRDYQAEIASHAEDGWRLAHIFAPTGPLALGCGGRVQFVELVFERHRDSGGVS